MSRRKLVAAALFFTLSGVIAFLPPFALLFSRDTRLAGIPLETVYVFTVWIVLILGARRFSRVLPDDTASSATRQDRPS